jgi:MoaA/NifB/PqqE/SkfB family radical SAM enzyme
MGDIINYARLLKNFNCKFNDTCLYVYDYGRPGSITSTPRGIRKFDIDRAKNIVKIESTLSDYVQIEITTRCNMNCFYCCIDSMSHTDMDMELFKSIIDKYYLKTKFRLQGIGEPTLHKNFLEMIDYIHSKNLKHEVDFVTNGKISINQEILDKIVEIVFSVDDVHRNLEKETKCLDISKDHILEVVKYRKEFKPELKIQIYSVNYGQSYFEIERFCIDNNITFFLKPLSTNSAFNHKYQTPNKILGSKCLYIDNLKMNYYYVDGKEAPCCFIPDSTLVQSRDDIRNQLRKGIIPSCCTGCNLLRT